MQLQERLAQPFSSLLYRSGALDRIARAHPNQLTALSYHRIDDSSRAGFDTFKPNVSATPAGFLLQMEYVKRRYNVITCEQLALWLRGQCKLPPHAAIITFDDGYFDNFANAYPILKQLGLPATIFLSTNVIGAKSPFYWDVAAYCFSHTVKQSAELPLTGPAAWPNEHERDLLVRSWMGRLKRLPEAQKLVAVNALAAALDVRIPPGTFAGLYLSWDQVRELSQNGIEMGAHTASHPILTSLSDAKVQEELLGSKSRIETEIAQPVISFAYPNGGSEDFSPKIEALLRKIGIEVAFTLMPGPTRYSTVRRAPLAIRRVFVSYLDVMPRFAAKLAGFARWIGH